MAQADTGRIIRVIGPVIDIGFTAGLPEIYTALRVTNPSPYMYFLRLGDFSLVGSSPEVLVRRTDARAVIAVEVFVEQHVVAEVRIALQPLEERRGLTIAEARLPQQQARHRALAPPHFQEVQQDERQRQTEQGQRERRQETHAWTRPFNCDSTNSSTGVSVITRW